MRSIEFPKGVRRRKNKLDNFVFSSRVRIARNLEGLMFPHFLKEKDKYEIDEKLTDKIKELPYRLNTMSFDEIPHGQVMVYVSTNVITQEFVRNGRKMISDMTGDWVILINEDDHLRIFAIEKGYNIKKIYQRLADVLGTVEDKVDFAFDEKWGYLTSSILNIGTGLRLSVLVNLYGMMAGKQIHAFTESVNSIGYSVANVGGDKSTSGLYYISNIYSIGLSEDDMVNEFEEMISRLYLLEMDMRRTYFSQRQEREIVFEEIFELKNRDKIGWSDMLYYVSLLDSMSGKYLTIGDRDELRTLVVQGTDDYLIYRNNIPADNTASERMELLKRVISQMKYKSVA
ncbi:MAG: hypothetical protein A2014_11945 [Spirochaetes bacterium GWF1_49_6]|nr:MAG: hypothetical protein A2014_11945 [Spirochaetes bacterium GWF1_49_6]